MVLALLPWAALLGLLIGRMFVGKLTTVTLLQYQGGVLFKRGHQVRELAAGQHRIWTGSEKVIFLDNRPTSVNFENRAVTLSDGATAVYGFSGCAEIRDVSKALYCARNCNDLPAYVLLCYSRLVLNRHASMGLLADQEGIAQEIIHRAKPKLSEAGFELQTFRFTHLSIASAPPQSGEQHSAAIS
jgi:hypothetical protein